MIISGRKVNVNTHKGKIAQEKIVEKYTALYAMFLKNNAIMAELVDALDSGSSKHLFVEVRVFFWAPFNI